MAFRDLALPIIRKVTGEIQRVRWTNKELERCFGRRSAQQVIESGNVHYMHSCLDITLSIDYEFQTFWKDEIKNSQVICNDDWQGDDDQCIVKSLTPRGPNYML